MTRLLSIITLIVLVLLITANIIQNHGQVCKDHIPRSQEIAFEIKEDLLKGRHDAVIEKVTETLKNHPLSADILGMRALSHALKGDFENAREDSDLASYKNPGTDCGWANFARGLIYYNDGNPEKALDEFGSATQLGAECSLLYSYIASAEFDLNIIDRSLIDCEKSLERESENLAAQLVKVKVNLVKLKNQRALYLVRSILEKDPENVEARLLELISMSKLDGEKIPGKKIEDLLSSIEPQIKRLENDNSYGIKRKKAGLYATRAFLYRFKNLQASAIHEFEKSLDMMPDQPLAVESYAEALLDRGRIVDAGSLFKKYEKRDNTQNLAWQRLKSRVKAMDQVSERKVKQP